MASGEQELARQIRANTAGDRERIYLTRLDISHPEAAINRLRGKAGPVLDAAEALFLDCCNQLAISDENGGNVSVIRVNSKNVHVWMKSPTDWAQSSM